MGKKIHIQGKNFYLFRVFENKINYEIIYISITVNYI